MKGASKCIFRYFLSDKIDPTLMKYVLSGVVLSARYVAVKGAKSKALIFTIDLFRQRLCFSLSYLQVMYPLHLFVFSVCSSRSRSE